MANTFGQNFLAGFQVASQQQRARQREEMERQQLALERQRTLASIKAQEASVKAQEEQARAQAIERQQQDVLMQLKLAETQDAPTTAVAPEAGGVGPPAPAPAQVFEAPLHGGGRLSAPARYREDIQQQQLDATTQQGQAKLGLAVEQARALAPVEAEAARLKAEAEFPTQARLAAIRAAGQERGRETGFAPEEIRAIGDQVVQQRNPELLGSMLKRDATAVIKDLASRGLSVPRKLTGEEQKVARQAEVGLSAVRDMERLYKQNPNVLTAATAPGGSLGLRIAGALTGTPAAEFETARKRATDPEMRAATGAALNKDEQKFYDQLQARLFDDPKTVGYKTRQLKALYAGLLGYPVTIRMPDGAEFIVQDTFSPTQRHRMREAIRLGGDLVE